MLKKTLFIISLLILVSCGKNEELKSPAEEQINKYREELKDCKEGKASDDKEANSAIAGDNSAQKPEGNIIPVVPKETPHIRGFGIEEDDIVYGNRESKVVVIEYFSPTCPHCVTYHKKIFPEIRSKYIDTNKIAYISREFIGNKQDLDAAVLARCGGSIKSYDNFMQIFLEQQDSWAFSKNYREILTNIGTLGGIGPEKYAKCLNDEAKIQILMDNTLLVSKVPQFIGTPTFFINGKKFDKPYTVVELSKAIDLALGIR